MKNQNLNNIIVIGDIHGRNLWKNIISKEVDVNKIIFIGDYFDSRDDISVQQQVDNFKEILEFKKNNMDKVILLLGNHDFHYLKDARENYSGFNQYHFIDINELIEPSVRSGLVTVCYTHDNYVFTHAGITKTWCNDNDIDINNLSDSINQALFENPNAFRFNMGDNFSRTGDDVTQSPIWVRIPSLFKDKLDGKTFVIGHTTLMELTITDDIIGIDTLGTTGEYLLIKDGIPMAKKIDIN